MANVRANFPDLFLADMLPAMDELIFQKFDPYPPQFSKVFRVMNSTRSIEQTTQLSGLGLPALVAEGQNVSYDTAVPGFAKTYIHDQFASGYKASRIMADDDKWGILKKMATELGKGARELLEIRVWSHINNGFSGSYLGPDGQPLFSLSHPCVKSGLTQKNMLTTAADLSSTSIQLMLTDFRQMRDSSGKKVRVAPKTLLVSAEQEWLAAQAMENKMRGDTVNPNAINELRHRDMYGGFTEWMVGDYLTDPDAWGIVGAKEDTELRFYWREKPNTMHDVDFDSRSIKTALWLRYSSGWSDFYGIMFTPGA